MKFVERWLKTDATATRPMLEIEYLRSTELPQEEVYEKLEHELRRNYVSPQSLAQMLGQLGASQTAAAIARAKVPTVPRQQVGDFGEALAAAHFRHARKWCVPILKLRWKQGRNQPVHGADVVALRLRATPPIIAVPEVKARSTRNKQVGVEAHESLSKVIDRLDETITYVAERLSEVNPALASRVTELLAPESAPDVERFIVLVHDDGVWNDDVLDELESVLTEPTNALVIRIPELRDLIDSVYSRLLAEEQS